ncbi:hypothetical protein GWI33_001720 [Rhynchophorus ferrugineus]|uniref:Deleted in lung and esophageal cancer protein 1 n=1 Tax=Rhynchophorus ferrugineus TaxID=354439 RepID=A0A834IXU4_RHYFE|nr:hypothetical protein GWI33_001720 [Rhynchophorus ferrugineus]
MDLIPKIPESIQTSTEIRNAFQEELHKDTFPLDIANNVTKYNIDKELSLIESGKYALQINEEFLRKSENITTTEKCIMKQHAEYLIKKNNIEKDEFLKEMCKLKTDDIFDLIEVDPLVTRYGLIKKCDLYPDVTRQFLDFRFNTFHRCKNCLDTFKSFKKTKKQTHVKKIRKKEPDKKQELTAKQFVIEPTTIEFTNYKINVLYQKEIKIINTSSYIQSICILTYPKLKMFRLFFSSQKVAPGMSLKAVIQFKSDANINKRDKMFFINGKGQKMKITLRCSIDPPILFGLIYRSNDESRNLLRTNYLRSKSYSPKRNRALNQTIDCGACLATDYILITFYLLNKGHTAKFFIVSEDNWFNENVNKISDIMEHNHLGFWIYPIYFEIKSGETAEINIIFQPLTCNLHIDTLFLISSNNIYQEIDIIGDAVCFNKKLISVEVPDLLTELENKPGYRIFLKYTNVNEVIKLTLRIHNKSQLSLQYECKFYPKDDALFDMSNWKLTQTDCVKLLPYSSNDIHLFIVPQSNISGYYNTILRIFIKNIPIASLDEEEEFIIETSNSLKETVEGLSLVDVLLVEVELACFVTEQKTIKGKDLNSFSDRCKKCKSCCCCKKRVPRAKLSFSEQFLDFAVLPIGVDIKRDFYIINHSMQKLYWKIVEMRYNIDMQPYIHIIENPNISVREGILAKNQRRLLSYNITNQNPTHWLSILVLFSCEQIESEQILLYKMRAESICLVKYEIDNLDIKVKSQSQEPIICPLQMLYVDIPTDIEFELQNNSFMNGCFYFLKPTGEESEKVTVEYKPQCGTIQAKTSKKINLNVTCHDIGILEDIYLPCFIGKGQKLMSIKLLCVVDCIHVFFYLPCKSNEEFEKVLWPPKVVYEYDRNWSQYCICEDMTYEDAIMNIQNIIELNRIERSNETINELKMSESAERKAAVSCDSFQSDEGPLKVLVNTDTEIFLQDLVVEVKNVVTKTPKKITFYIENVTPIVTKYNVQCTSYGGDSKTIRRVLKTTYKTTEELWEPLIENNSILIQPEKDTGILNGHQTIFVDIWIYSSTWGIYTEEIIVDISNITSFSFSLIAEVIGCPLLVPFGIGSTAKYPTIRLGSISKYSENITRNIIISNISSIDINVVWHVFLKPKKRKEANPPAFNFLCDVVGNTEERFNFDLTEEYHGEQSCKFVEIYPSKMVIARKSKTTIEVSFLPKIVENNEKIYPVQCFILGQIYTTDDGRFKSNYFYRKSTSLLLELSTTIVQPYLEFNTNEDNTHLYIYANDVLIYRKSIFYMKINVRNPLTFTIKALLAVGEPFCLKDMDDTIVLKPGECKEITLPCLINYENVQKWAAQTYGIIKNVNENESNETSKIAHSEKSVDEYNKILTLNKKLFIHHHGEFKQVIPLHIHIYYPHISVKPVHIKFGYVLIGCTEMASIRVFNLTGNVKIIKKVLE